MGRLIAEPCESVRHKITGIAGWGEKILRRMVPRDACQHLVARSFADEWGACKEG